MSGTPVEDNLFYRGNILVHCLNTYTKQLSIFCITIKLSTAERKRHRSVFMASIHYPCLRAVSTGRVHG